MVILIPKMLDLTILLNQGREQVPVTKMVDPFDVKMGSILNIVPLLRDEGRTFASGSVVLAERLAALRSGDQQQIEAWGNTYYDLADACLTFEDVLKVQPDSPLLKGIRGIVETAEGLYVAVSAAAVSAAAKHEMRYFPVRASETVNYSVGDSKVKRTVTDVVLLKYAQPAYVELSGDQFNAVDAQPLNRGDFVYQRDMRAEEIVKDGDVVHPVYKALLPAELVVPLVAETFAFNKRTYGYDANMGLYLASEPQEHAELRAFCASRLNNGSRLDGDFSIGINGNRLVGVVEGSAAGAAKK